MKQTDRGQKGERRGILVERDEGTRQRTCMNDPRTWTRVRELTVGVGNGMGGRGQRGKNWDNCNRIIIINDLKKKKKEK